MFKKKNAEEIQYKKKLKEEQRETAQYKPFKKNFKPYFYLSLLLAVVGFGVGNFMLMLPGKDLFEKMAFISSNKLNAFINSNFIDFFKSFNMFSIGMALMFFFLGLLGFVYRNDRGTYRNEEEHGSARFATVQELLKYRDKDPLNNMILSRNVQMGLFNKNLLQSAQKNKSVTVIGDSGAAKTLAFIKTNLMQTNASFIVTDPDGGIIFEVGQLLHDEKYTIKVLDLNTLSNSDTFNVFNYIKTEIDIDRVLEAITEGTKKGERQGEEFWIQAEALLVRSLLAYLWFDGQINNYTPNLGMISDMLRNLKRVDPKKPSPVEEWFNELEKEKPNNYATRQWRLFNDLYESETRASVLGVAAARYSVFDHEQVRDMIRKDTMNIEKWNEEKTAVFIAIPETNDSYNFIAAIFMSTIMETLRHKSDQVRKGLMTLPEEKKLLHVRFLIDEFANIGRIPNFDKALATFRKREMSFAIILQSLNQLQAMYKDSWAGILNNCASLLFLGGEEEKTTKYLSQRAGKQTISIRNQSVSRGSKSSGSENHQKQARDLMTPDEISRLDGDECLVFISKEYVFKDKKYFAFDHPKAYLLASSPEDKRWYYYKRYMNEDEKILDDVNNGKVEVIDHGVIEGNVA